MWNARKAQLDLELGGRQQPAKRSRSRSCSPSTAGRWGHRRAPQAGKPQRKGQQAEAAGCEATRRRFSSRTQTSSDGEGSPSDFSAGGEVQNHHPETVLAEEAAAEAERQLEELLSKSRVRGRGAVGPRADEPGPYLPASAAGVLQWPAVWANAYPDIHAL